MVSADSGLVALGFVRSLGVEFLPNLVRRFKDHYENVRFTFVQNTGRELDKKILNGQIDLAFGPRGAPDLEWTVVFEQEYRLIVPISHPLARARKVALASLKHERFVSFKEDRKFREITEGFCKQAGFIPNYSFEGDDISSIIGFVGSGFGIAIVSPQDVKSSQRVTSLHLEPPPHRPIGISWLKNRYLSSGARRFRDFVLSGGNIHILENAL